MPAHHFGQPAPYRAVAAAVTPEQQRILALIVVHAATSTWLRELTVDDIDIARRRITIAEHTRPLDDLTLRLLLRHLDHRRHRLSRATNRPVFISQSTAYGTGPASIYWLQTRVQDLGVTPGRLRIARQLDEALISGGDALRVASVFGITEQTAVLYAEAARAILERNANREPRSRACMAIRPRSGQTVLPRLLSANRGLAESQSVREAPCEDVVVPDDRGRQIELATITYRLLTPTGPGQPARPRSPANTNGSKQSPAQRTTTRMQGNRRP
jgi:hypothetical protein